MAVHPLLGGGVAFFVEAPDRFPDVFDDVDEVDEDCHRHGAGGGLPGDPVDLVVVPVDERDPGSLVAWVAPSGFVEYAG